MGRANWAPQSSYPNQLGCEAPNKPIPPKSHKKLSFLLDKTSRVWFEDRTPEYRENKVGGSFRYIAGPRVPSTPDWGRQKRSPTSDIAIDGNRFAQSRDRIRA